MILIDTLLAEYKWSLDFVLWVLPLQQAFAFYSAIGARYEVAPKGPTYAEQEVIAKHFKKRSEIRKRSAVRGQRSVVKKHPQSKIRNPKFR